eukprot:325157-Hanusia_phi.AAC.1
MDYRRRGLGGVDCRRRGLGGASHGREQSPVLACQSICGQRAQLLLESRFAEAIFNYIISCSEPCHERIVL